MSDKPKVAVVPVAVSAFVVTVPRVTLDDCPSPTLRLKVTLGESIVPAVYRAYK